MQKRVHSANIRSPEVLAIADQLHEVFRKLPKDTDMDHVMPALLIHIAEMANLMGIPQSDINQMITQIREVTLADDGKTPEQIKQTLGLEFEPN